MNLIQLFVAYYHESDNQFRMIITEETSLNLNSEYLESFNSTLYKQLVSYPTEVISLMDVIINELFSEKLRQRSLDAEGIYHAL